MNTIAFFNNRGGIGRTSIVYHLACMYADLGLPILAADLDPQANLTGMFLDDNRLAELWPDPPPHDASDRPPTVYGALGPLLDGTGDIRAPHIEGIDVSLGLLVGDLALAASEDELSSQWSDCLDRKPRAFRVLSGFWRILEAAAREHGADLVLIDVGPSLGPISRAALIGAEHVVIPLAPDLHSLQALRVLGPALRRWRTEWADRRERNPLPDVSIPFGAMEPVGYVVMPHAVRFDRPMYARDRCMARIPDVYRDAVLGEPTGEPPKAVGADRHGLGGHSLGALKHYPGLESLAQDARKPMFALRPADGAHGSLGQAVQDSYREYLSLAREIARRCQVRLPSPPGP